MKILSFKKSDPKVEWMVRLCYPSYKGRRPVKVEARQSYRVTDYWDGGSRDYVEFVDLKTRRRLSQDQLSFEKQTQGNPFNLNIGTVQLSPGVAAVEQCIFCGKNLGIRIYVHPDSFGDFA